MADNPAWKPLGREQLAERLARDIPEGWSVNLGIGIPTLVGNFVPQEREVIFHSENGILGMGPAPPENEINPWLVNASRQHVSLRTGASYLNHADSFALVRGGHLDLCVLGGFQVAENGDLANWARSDDDNAPAIGGAMDLAAGARRIWVVMEHITRSGEKRLLRRCTYPLTAKACVVRVYTDLAVIDVTPKGFVVTDMVPGLGVDELQERTGATLHPAQ
ncbi:MAG TPA: 3-oxoacid CoA-transferase subunit B [Stellaceae bacterium]|jgi:3-oxoadipate CoA-transferase beta subunit|nr:3-oxoacid CoA-transferase subunit B [Stellaceae bacterium]